jgi:hypothetical protein
VLENDTYVDDIINSQDTQQDCMVVAEEIVEILARGSMSVKAFTFSGNKPDEKVSADGMHVGLAGPPKPTPSNWMSALPAWGRPSVAGDLNRSRATTRRR